MTIGHSVLGSGAEHVIVLHDWMSTHQSFDDLQPYLSPDSFTYTFADLRGYGQSRAIRGEHSVAEASRDVLALANQLGWSRFHLLGHSMSGMIGQRLSLDAPDRLKSLILTTPVTAAGMPLDEDGRRLFEGAVRDDALWTTVARAVTSDRLGDRFYQRKLAHHRSQVAIEAFAGFLTMWTETDFSAEMTSLETPVLVVAGEHDFPAFSKASYEATIAKWYRDARISLLENAGHYPMSETPPIYARTVEDFLHERA